MRSTSASSRLETALGWGQWATRDLHQRQRASDINALLTLSHLSICKKLDTASRSTVRTENDGVSLSSSPSQTPRPKVDTRAEFCFLLDMRNQLLAYARVSTKKQSVDQQIDALVGAGVDTDRIVSDVLSGASRDRPGLDALLDYAREGDTIDVVALDRLGRSLSHMVKTIEELQERGVNLRSLREGIDFATATGRLQAAIFSAMAEYERELIKERAAAAREAAAACGREMGRPPALNPSQAETARRMREGGFDITTIAKTLNVSRATIYRYTEQAEHI